MEPRFNLNRPPVSDEEINSKKDFGELVNKFKQQSIEKARSDVNFLKNKKITYSAIIAGVAVVCTVTYFSVFKKEPKKSQNAYDKITTTSPSSAKPATGKPAKAFVAPPIASLNVPYTSYKVKSEQGATLRHKSNSKISIPQKAFVNKQGQDIVGEVEIRYREFHNQADIIGSGIPMGYDSAGVKSQLESAGMIDIRGYQNNEPVFIKPGKIITVEFQSQHSDDRYNMYELDTIRRNWVYTGRDNSLADAAHAKPTANAHSEAQKPVKEEPENQKIRELQQQLNAIPPKLEQEKKNYETKISQLQKTPAPARPLKATTGRPQFRLDVDYKEFPELAAFKNAVFEVGTENKNYNPELAKITWTSAKIEEGPQKGKNYLLILTQINRVEKLIVYPALTGSSYDEALKVYESKYETYKNTLARREAEEKKLKEEYEATQVAYLTEQKNLSAEMAREKVRAQIEADKRLNQQTLDLSNAQKVSRIFQVTRFGICNSDCPQQFPSGASMNPIFLTGTGFIKPGLIYLVCTGRNLVFDFNDNRITYNPGESYSVCVFSDNKVYVCDKETFARCTKNNINKLPVKALGDDADATSLKMALGI